MIKTIRPKALIAWSSGKDSAWALHEIRCEGHYDVVGALTTINETFARVSMHGVRQELLTSQIKAIGLPLISVRIPFPCPNEIYEARMSETLHLAKAEGITHIVFGDLFLENVRAYREEKLAGTGITPVFPLWGIPTDVLAKKMIASGVETYLTTVDLKKLPAKFAGRRWDETLLAQLPDNIDPCGENGEFHSFVAAGPMLQDKISITVGQTVEREGFAYADLLPG